MVKDLKIENTHDLNMVTLAAYLKKWSIVTYFAKYLGSAIDCPDPEGMTPFMRLMVSGELQGAAFLLQCGAKVDFINMSQQTALYKVIEDCLLKDLSVE